MKVSLLTMGLLVSLGCDGLQPDEGAPPASAASELTAPSEGATPRVARFATLSAASLAGGTIKPTAWPAQAPSTLDVQHDVVKGRLDPAMVREVETSRLRGQLEGGAR
jgi:hypothetical protein